MGEKVLNLNKRKLKMKIYEHTIKHPILKCSFKVFLRTTSLIIFKQILTDFSSQHECPSIIIIVKIAEKGGQYYGSSIPRYYKVPVTEADIETSPYCI